MQIAGVASALPPNYYPQQDLMAALTAYWETQLENPRFLERLHTNTCVDGRYLACPMEEYLGMDTFGKTNEAWRRAAQELGEQAVTDALAHARLDKSLLGSFHFMSITGICSPSVDALLVNRMGLPRTIKRVPVFGLGCVGGAAGIARAADYVKAYPDQVALLLSVELCSLTLQRDDLSVANLISSGLFGDGAAAVLIAGSEVAVDGPRIIATRSSFYPETERVMGWDVSETGFKIVLSPEVPDVITRNLRRDVDGFLADHGLSRGDIGCWIFHTGGPKILRATQDALEVGQDAIQASWDCLRRTGNLSSSSVLFVLEEVFKNRRPAAGTWSLLGAMGPGFCSELVLLRW